MPATTPPPQTRPCTQTCNQPDTRADHQPDDDTQDDTQAGADELSDAEPTLLVEDQRFAIVPEWVINADIPDAAFRLYALLLRYGNTTGQRMPARPTLARRLHRSVDAIDRALRQLVTADLVRVEHRRAVQQNLSNRYHLRTSSPSATAAAAPAPDAASGRTTAATRSEPARGGCSRAATPGPTSAARVAADLRPDPDVFTQSTPPPGAAVVAAAKPGSQAAKAVKLTDARLLADCGITDIDDLSRRCTAARTALGQPTGRWTPQCLTLAIKMAVTNRNWPASSVVPALLAVAADKATRSPIRLAEAGPWWDIPTVGGGSGPDDQGDEVETRLAEARLADLGGRRVTLQAKARVELSREGMPVTRSTVVRRAVQILDRTPEPA